MLNKPKTCSGCDLEKLSQGFSIPEGSCKNKVLIVGEALGERELHDGLPFRPYAEAGSVLQSAIDKLGMEREEFGFWNMIACRPPFNQLEGARYEHPAINHCKVHFQSVFNKMKPKVILALGNIPLRHLIKEDIDDKKKASISSVRGYIFDSVYGIPIVPSFHPSYIRRTGLTYVGVLMWDIYTAVQVAKGNIIPNSYDLNNFITETTLENVYDFIQHCKKHPEYPIEYDIETPYTTKDIDESETEYLEKDVRDIISIQFRVKDFPAIFLEWTGNFITLATEILALPNPKVGWNNWKFDTFNLEYHLGKGAIKGEVHDAMWQWKHLNSDFKKWGRGLQHAANFYCPGLPAWKHLSESAPKQYGCIDVEVTHKIFEGVKTNLSALKLDGTSKNCYEGYLDDVVKLKPILDNMSARGFPIDLQERAKLKKKIEEQIRVTLIELQDMYPYELLNTKPALGYVRPPKDLDTAIETFKHAYKNFESPEYAIFDSKESEDFYFARFLEENTRIEDGEGKSMTGLVLQSFIIDGKKELRYCRKDRFKPGSSQQVLNYIKFKGYTVPKKKEYGGKDRETSSKDEVHKLAEETGDPIFFKIIELRELKKMNSTYVGTGKKGWKPDENGFIHSTFLPFPSTGQLSSSNPNIQNAPARGTRFSSPGYKQLAQDFRAIVAAKPGHTLLSCDWSSFHALTLGFEAEDETYIRLVRNDIHSYVGSWILSDELPRRIELLERKSLKVMRDFDSAENPHKAYIKHVGIVKEALERLQTLPYWITYEDKELKSQLVWIKDNFGFTRNSQAKPAILGIGFGMKVAKFYKLNRHSFDSIEQPTKIHGFLKRLFPKIFDYQETSKQLADDKTFLLTRYGYIRRFFEVFRWTLLKGPRKAKPNELIIKTKDGKWWSRQDGEQANEAVAYRPANDAFGKKKEAMRDLEERGLNEKYKLINEIHDDLMFMVPNEFLTEAIENVTSIMESPARYLINPVAPKGLTCAVEAKVGLNWANMKVVER